ncbi:MAG: short-chain dehydrogenase [Methanobacteriota archaeon]|jgi:3-oxoacyl-[acyl-carrier protein] reductase|uniref:SDR family oxidoreductase n=1 Tax=Marine Group III euryarchaeote TaxID=2173149 RepID=A0A7J4GS96_9ARCH|nr:MAG: short-chain dehydrogenase [Euryarchaeota archaeon]HIF36849.1 SDR family oxidoreductase [Marine Group III euryarchaeote]
MINLDGKRALVCGGTSGIGEAAAEAIRDCGADVVILSRSASGKNTIACNLEDLDSLNNSVSKEIENNGNFEILINNSGGPPSGPLIDAKPVDFEKAFLRHVLASQTLVQLVLPGMKEANYGRIINIISTSVKEPIVGLGVSNTIRGAMASWSKTFSKELPPSITINNVLPGFTATERLEELKQTLSKQKGISPNEVEKAWLGTVPEGRLADPSELGQVIAFLASPAASFVRGVSLPVDGGRTGSI